MGKDKDNDSNVTPPPSYEDTVEMKNVIHVKTSDADIRNEKTKTDKSTKEDDKDKEEEKEPELAPVGVFELVNSSN